MEEKDIGPKNKINCPFCWALVTQSIPLGDCLFDNNIASLEKGSLNEELSRVACEYACERFFLIG